MRKKPKMDIEVLLMDITKIGSKADAIVNAANESLLGGGGVDGAIHRAAGPELLKECIALHGCKPGEAKATKAYNLDNKYIIHTVGPRYYSDPHPQETLTNCYINSLKLADSLHLESIVFPSISTGAYGYPFEEATDIMIKTICEYKAKTIKKVFICIYPNEERYRLCQDTLNNYLKESY